MGKYVNGAALDAALSYIRTNAASLVLCSGQPADYTAATTLKSEGGARLGAVSIGAGDITLADGDASGRKLTVAAQSGVEVEESARSGTEGYQWDHVAVVSADALLLATPLSAAQDVTAGNTASTQAFDYEIPDPV